MEHKAKPRKVLSIITLFLTIFLICSCLAHSRKLASPPSPAPGIEGPIAEVFIRRVNGKAMRGSTPATCDGRCNQCLPCLPVEVSVRVMNQLEEYEYYPQVWKCMCNDNMFSP